MHTHMYTSAVCRWMRGDWSVLSSIHRQHQIFSSEQLHFARNGLTFIHQKWEDSWKPLEKSQFQIMQNHGSLVISLLTLWMQGATIPVSRTKQVIVAAFLPLPSPVLLKKYHRIYVLSFSSLSLPPSLFHSRSVFVCAPNDLKCLLKVFFYFAYASMALSRTRAQQNGPHSGRSHK